MTALTRRDGDLLSHFDKMDESEAQTEKTSLKHLFFKKHDVAANRGQFRGCLPLEHLFGFCKTFEKIIKN